MATIKNEEEELSITLSRVLFRLRREMLQGIVDNKSPDLGYSILKRQREREKIARGTV